MDDIKPFVIKISEYSKYAPRAKELHFLHGNGGLEAVRRSAEQYQGDYGSLVFK